MRYLSVLFVLFFTIPTGLVAQSWLEDNPQWTNRFHHAIKGLGTEYCTITGDSVIDGVQGKVCTRIRDYDNYPPLTTKRFVFQQGDSVFCRDFDRNILLYDMSMQPGQLMAIKSYYWDTVLTITIVETGIISLNNQTLRTQEFIGYKSNLQNGFFAGASLKKWAPFR